MRLSEGVCLHPHLTGAEQRWLDDRRRSVRPLRVKAWRFVCLLYALTIKLLIAEVDGQARTGSVSLATTGGSPIDRPPPTFSDSWSAGGTEELTARPPAVSLEWFVFWWNTTEAINFIAAVMQRAVTHVGVSLTIQISSCQSNRKKTLNTVCHYWSSQAFLLTYCIF